MKKLQILLASLFLFCNVYLHAQTADELVNKHLAAIGGKEVIKKITSQITESTLSVMGSDLSATTTILVGKGFKNVAEFNGQQIIQVVTPTSGWMINPLQGINDAQALPQDQVKAAQSSFDLGGDLYNYKEKGSTITLSGKEKVEGVDAYKLKLTNKDGRSTFFFIDPSTFYVIKRETTSSVNGQDVTSTALFSNFKKTDIGFVMPFTTVTNQGFEITVTINKVEFNREVDPKIFQMPK